MSTFLIIFSVVSCYLLIGILFAAFDEVFLSSRFNEPTPGLWAVAWPLLIVVIIGLFVYYSLYSFIRNGLREVKNRTGRK